MKSCDTCQNYIWGDDVTPIPDEWCAQCLLNWLRKPVEEVVKDA